MAEHATAALLALLPHDQGEETTRRGSTRQPACAALAQYLPRSAGKPTCATRERPGRVSLGRFMSHRCLPGTKEAIEQSLRVDHAAKIGMRAAFHKIARLS
jgi:hypothetical protein